MREYGKYDVEAWSDLLADAVKIYFESEVLDEYSIYRIRQSIKRYGITFLAAMFTQKITFFENAEKSGLLDSRYFYIFWRILEKEINDKQKLIVDLVDQTCGLKECYRYNPAIVACAITSEFAPKINEAKLCELINNLADKQISITSRYKESGECFYLFAKYVPNAPIEKLANVVIQRGEAEWIYKFAKDVPNAPIERLANAVIARGEAKWIYNFAKDVPNAPIERLADAVILSGEGEWIYNFAKDVPNAPIEKLTNAEIRFANSYGIRLFIQGVPNASVGKLVQALILKEDDKETYLSVESILKRNPNNAVNVLKWLVIEFEKANISIDSFVKYFNKKADMYNKILFIKARLELKIDRLFGKQGALNINLNSTLLGLGEPTIALEQPQLPKSFDKESLREEFINTFTYVIKESANLDSQTQEYYQREASSILNAFMDSASDLKEATNLLNRLNELKHKLDLLLANNKEFKEGEKII